MISSYSWFSKIITEDNGYVFELLDKSLSLADCRKEQVELSRVIIKKQLPWWWAYFCLAHDAHSKNRISSALKYYKKMVDIGGFDQDFLPSLSEFMVAHGDVEDLKKILQLFDDKESAEYINYSVFLKELEKDYQGGLELCNKGLEKYATLSHLSTHKAEFYIKLEQPEKAKEIYYSLLESEILVLRRNAILGLVFQLDIENKAEESLKLLQDFLNKEENDSEDNEWQYLINLQMGASLRLTKRFQEAFEYLLISKSFKESPNIYYELIIVAHAMNRFDEAESFMAKAESKFKTDNVLKYLRFNLNEALGNWEHTILLAERLGLDWFRKNDLFSEGIAFKLIALLNLDKPFEALKFCEDILDELLEHQELRDLRQQAFKETEAQYEQYRNLIGSQTSKLKELKKTRKLLIEENRKKRNNKNKLEKSLNSQRVLEQELGRLRNQNPPEKNKAPSVSNSPKPFEVLKKEYPQICKALPTHLMKILISAELLWNKLSEHPDQDHGPVVLQLARVVEGMVNKTMIDPLVKKVLNMGLEISELSSISGGIISKSLNRLSLGECAHLLQGPTITRGPTDAQQVEINVRSTENHKKILNALWDHPPFSKLSQPTLYYLKNSLPWDLRKLAKIRNRAGHAGQIILRDKAKEIRIHVLKKKSLLDQLARIEGVSI